MLVGVGVVGLFERVQSVEPRRVGGVVVALLLHAAVPPTHLS